MRRVVGAEVFAEVSTSPSAFFLRLTLAVETCCGGMIGRLSNIAAITLRFRSPVLWFTDSSPGDVDDAMFSLVDAIFVGRLDLNLNESLDFLCSLPVASDDGLDRSSPSSNFILHSSASTSFCS